MRPVIRAEHPEDLAPRPPRQPRRQRLASRRDGSPVAPGGGISKPCGCRYTRTAGQWLHVTPCRSHDLQPFPITDDHMQEAFAS